MPAPSGLFNKPAGLGEIFRTCRRKIEDGAHEGCDIDANDIGASLSERNRARTANAARCTSDDSDLAIKLKH